MNSAIETSQLTKFYGQHRGVEGLNLDVHEGEVFGLLGPNGAGKTTTIRLLLDFLRPTSGSARVFGLDPSRNGVEIRRRIGYLPGDFTTYTGLTVRDVLRFYTSLRNSPPTQADALCERFDLDTSRKIGELSRGNRQKIGLVQAFMNDPELLVLDEPTSGLDPLLQQEFARLVSEEREAGHTLLISSHALPEVEAICDRVGIIRDGRLVAVEEIEALKARAVRRLEIQFGEPVPLASFDSLAGVTDAVMTDHRLTCSVTGSMDAVIKAASRYEVARLTSHEPRLDEVFLAYYGADDESGETPPKPTVTTEDDRVP